MRANLKGLILGAVIMSLAGWMILRPGFFVSSGGAEKAQTPDSTNLNSGNQQSAQAQQAVNSGAGGALAPAPDAGSATQQGTPLDLTDQRKIALVTEILKSKNDNDPRMDTELRDLSPAAKAVLQKKYSEIEPEKRNARGTMVFLLGREIKDASELGFFKSVLQEKPCLSLENCEKAPGGHSGEEEHLEAINETTANYPQLLAVRALAHRANDLVDTGQEGSPLYTAILATLKEALQSPNPKVVEAAGRALEELKRE